MGLSKPRKTQKLREKSAPLNRRTIYYCCYMYYISCSMYNIYKQKLPTLSRHFYNMLLYYMYVVDDLKTPYMYLILYYMYVVSIYGNNHKIHVRKGRIFPAIFEFFVFLKSILYRFQKRCEWLNSKKWNGFVKIRKTQKLREKSAPLNRRTIYYCCYMYYISCSMYNIYKQKLPTLSRHFYNMLLYYMYVVDDLNPTICIWCCKSGCGSWNRDRNGSSNIYKIAYQAIYGMERPSYLCRTSNQAVLTNCYKQNIHKVWKDLNFE